MVSAIIANNDKTHSSGAHASYSSIHGAGGHYTLGDWISRVRTKRREMRRKNTNLRVAAVLAVTLRKAEADLRVRQQERLKKWEELNKEIQSELGLDLPEEQLLSGSFFMQQHQQQQQSSAAPAASQIQSDYVNQPSSSPPPPPQSNQLIFNDNVQLHQQQQFYVQQQQQPTVEQQQAAEEIWRTDLSDLDQFIQSLKQVKTCVVR